MPAAAGCSTTEENPGTRWRRFRQMRGRVLIAPRSQQLHHRGRCRRALVRILVHHRRDHVAETRRQIRIEMQRVERSLIQMPANLVGRVAARKRNLAGHCVIQRASQRIHVAHRQNLIWLANRFRRQDNRPYPPANSACPAGRLPSSSSIKNQAKPEIGHLRPAIRRHEQIARLHVAMHKPAPMCVMQSLGRLRNNRRRDGEGQRPIPPHELPQIGPRHVLRHKEISIALVVGIRHTHQVRMVELHCARISR